MDFEVRAKSYSMDDWAGRGEQSVEPRLVSRWDRNVLDVKFLEGLDPSELGERIGRMVSEMGDRGEPAGCERAFLNLTVLCPEALLPDGATAIEPHHVPEMLSKLRLLVDVSEQLVRACIESDCGEALVDVAVYLARDAGRLAVACAGVAASGKALAWEDNEGAMDEDLAAALSLDPEFFIRPLSMDEMALLARVLWFATRASHLAEQGDEARMRGVIARRHAEHIEGGCPVAGAVGIR